VTAGPLATAERGRIAILDYGMGNLRSVEKALERAGAKAVLTRDLALARQCDGVVLPGVGAFPEAMRNLRRLGMDALVEIHGEAEADAALAVGARLIGVNHRDLATFTMDMGLTERLAPRLPEGAVLVAESGIKTAADVRRLGEAGAHAVLVGETLMRAPSPGAALAALLAG